MKRIAVLAPILAALSLAMPQPALAETPAEIEEQCGAAMEDLICSVNSTIRP